MNIDSSVLHTRSRQSPIAIVFMLLKYLQIGVRQFWPILLLAFIGGRREGRSGFDRISYVVLIIALFQMLNSLLAYFRYFFYVEGEELVIEQGLIRRSRTSIPFDRIQSVNFEQSFLHRIFNVVKISLDTAGSSQQEVSLSALTREKAELLRNYILERKAEMNAEAREITEEGESIEEKVKEASSHKIYERDMRELVRMGLTQNHLRTGALIIGSVFGAFFGAFQLFQDNLGMKIEEMLDYVIRFFPGLAQSYQAWMGWLAVPLFMILVVLLSLIQTVMRYYKLQVWRTSKGFKTVSGLFTRQEKSGILSKIQYMSWHTHPLRKAFGLYDLRLYQASSATVSRKGAVFIPGNAESDLPIFKDALFRPEDQQGLQRFKFSPLIVLRRTLFTGIIPALLIMAGSSFNIGWNALFVLLWIPLVWWYQHRYQRRSYYEINDELLLLHTGAIGSTYKILSLFKAQGVRLRQSIYQRRKGVADVTLYTASGSVELPYVPLEQAELVRDFILYKVESTDLYWM